MAAAKDKNYSVGEITQYIRLLLEENNLLRGIWVNGEISNLTKHSSGHVYFTIKDEDAQLTVVMFKSAAIQYPDFPRNGDKVSVSGDITVYPARGNYQLIAKKIEKQGLGDLHRKFLELKSKLEKEGLFESIHKKPIPRFPQIIGIATSPTGAVIKDIIDTVSRRYPHVKLLLSPTVVQGENGKQSVIDSLQKLQKANADIIILARGGGSLEDLWCFNEEQVVRAIFDCKIPVISAIGHETDFTIADFVADKRAATPTAAAELAVPDVREIKKALDDGERILKRNLRFFIDFRRQVLDDYQNRLSNSLSKKIMQFRGTLDTFEAKLESLDMGKVLERGYSVSLKDGKPILNADELKSGELITSIFSKGRATSILKEIKKNEE